MTASAKIKSFLEKEKIGFQILEHDVAYTAMETAGSQHVPGRQFIKSVILFADDKFVMCVLPAIHKVDIEKFKKNTNAKEARLATEKEVSKLFPDYEVGAEPPFSLTNKIEIYLDKILEENDEVAFNAGTHTDIIKIKFKDYLKLSKAKVVDFGVHIQPKITAK